MEKTYICAHLLNKGLNFFAVHEYVRLDQMVFIICKHTLICFTQCPTRKCENRQIARINPSGKFATYVAGDIQLITCGVRIKIV